MAPRVFVISIVGLFIIFGSYLGVSIVDELWDWRLLVREGKYGKLLNNYIKMSKINRYLKILRLGFFQPRLVNAPIPGT